MNERVAFLAMWNCEEGFPPMPPTYPLEAVRGRERRKEEVFAVIKSGGRQYKVSVGQTLEVNRLPVEEGSQVKFEEVLLISDADNTMVGSPLVANAMVMATATKQGRGKKVIVFKYKSKKRYRHKRGHRQELTFLTIDDIVADGKSLVTGEAPKEKETPAVEQIETPPEPTELEAATGGVSETETGTETESEGEKRTSRRRRTARVEDAENAENVESETEE